MPAHQSSPALEPPCPGCHCQKPSRLPPVMPLPFRRVSCPGSRPPPVRTSASSSSSKTLVSGEIACFPILARASDDPRRTNIRVLLSPKSTAGSRAFPSSLKPLSPCHGLPYRHPLVPLPVERPHGQFLFWQGRWLLLFAHPLSASFSAEERTRTDLESPHHAQGKCHPPSKISGSESCLSVPASRLKKRGLCIHGCRGRQDQPSWCPRRANRTSFRPSAFVGLWCQRPEIRLLERLQLHQSLVALTLQYPKVAPERHRACLEVSLFSHRRLFASARHYSWQAVGDSLSQENKKPTSCQSGLAIDSPLLK